MPRVTDLVNPTKRTSTRLINHIAIVADISGSMQHLRPKLVQSINEQVDNIKINAANSDQETYVSVYFFDAYVYPRTIGTFPEAVQRLTTAEIAHMGGGMTALHDAVARAISDFKGAKYANEPRTSFLVMTLTDGGENASHTLGGTLRNDIRQCQLTDRWSFAFLVPPGGTKAIKNLGIAEGNIQEWEGTEKGLDVAHHSTKLATSSYLSMRSAGGTKTEAFYTDLSKVKKADLKKLDDVSGDFRRLKVDKETPIATFCKTKLGAYPLGKAYYELTKTEQIQDHKRLVIEDRTAKKLYGGDEAKDLIGIASGTGVTVKVTPGNHANFRIFVNSTSMNRKLVRGTDLLVEK